jgi:hypothetical protein
VCANIGQREGGRWTALDGRAIYDHAKAATDGQVTAGATYTLRHSHASACHYVSTLSVPEICRRLGHSQ